MTKPAKISDLDLHAYIDGELNADQARTIEEAVARSPALAVRLAGYRADKEMLKRMYAPLAQRPIPLAWVALARTTTPVRARHSWRLVGTIAAALLVILVGVSFHLGQRQNLGGDVVEAALQVRSGTVGPQKAVTVDGMAEARHYDAALRQVVGANVKVPDLEPMAYHITGLRFYDGAAEVSYRDGQDRVFTLYLRPSDGKTRFDQFEQKGLRICVWQDDRISTVMAGDISAAVMQRLASLTYIGLTA